MFTDRNYFNNPKAWLKTPAHEAPHSPEEIALVQKEVDSILGTVRGKSKALIIWNGDVRYWKEYYSDWDAFGKPKGQLQRRPQVLYKRVSDGAGNFLRFAFPPRYLLMTVMQPEQYVPTWEKDSKIFDPKRRCFIQMQPETPPALKLRWYETIAGHNGFCCPEAAKEERSCWGLYAHPRAVLEGLRETMKGMQAAGIKQSNPFESADQVAERALNRSCNDYEEYTLRKFREHRIRTIEENPMAAIALAAPEMLTRRAPLANIRRALKDEVARETEAMEHALRGK